MQRFLLLGLVLCATGLASGQTPPGSNQNQSQQPQPSQTNPANPEQPQDPTAPTAATPVAPMPPSAVPGAGGTASAQPAHMVRISGAVMEGLLTHKVDPVAPPAAPAGYTGSVVVDTIVGADGRVKSAKPMSGSSIFRGAAVDAVKQYVYKPYQLNGAPVDVETTVTVAFK